MAILYEKPNKGVCYTLLLYFRSESISKHSICDITRNVNTK